MAPGFTQNNASVILKSMHRLKSIIKKIAKHILDILFPKYCLGCNKEAFYLCPTCLDKIPAQKSITCFICGRRSPTGESCQNCRHKNRFSLNGLLVASDWNSSLLRQVIYEYKYHFIKELSKPLSEIMIKFLETYALRNLKTDEIILIPVPLHPRRFLWRGFNQAEILAQKIGGYFDLTTANNILTRPRHTFPQADIKDQKERKINVKSAFALSKKHTRKNSDFLKNKVIILVDDVCTTASTLEECARALKPLKPKKIWGLVVARG